MGFIDSLFKTPVKPSAKTSTIPPAITALSGGKVLVPSKTTTTIKSDPISNFALSMAQPVSTVLSKLGISQTKYAQDTQSPIIRTTSSGGSVITAPAPKKSSGGGTSKNLIIPAAVGGALVSSITSPTATPPSTPPPNIPDTPGVPSGNSNSGGDNMDIRALWNKYADDAAILALAGVGGYGLYRGANALASKAESAFNIDIPFLGGSGGHKYKKRRGIHIYAGEIKAINKVAAKMKRMDKVVNKIGYDIKKKVRTVFEGGRRK